MKTFDSKFNCLLDLASGVGSHTRVFSCVLGLGLRDDEEWHHGWGITDSHTCIRKQCVIFEPSDGGWRIRLGHTGYLEDVTLKYLWFWTNRKDLRRFWNSCQIWGILCYWYILSVAFVFISLSCSKYLSHSDYIHTLWQVKLTDRHQFYSKMNMEITNHTMYTKQLLIMVS